MALLPQFAGPNGTLDSHGRWCGACECGHPGSQRPAASRWMRGCKGGAGLGCGGLGVPPSGGRRVAQCGYTDHAGLLAWWPAFKRRLAGESRRINCVAQRHRQAPSQRQRSAVQAAAAAEAATREAPTEAAASAAMAAMMEAQAEVVAAQVGRTWRTGNTIAHTHSCEDAMTTIGFLSGSAPRRSNQQLTGCLQSDAIVNPVPSWQERCPPLGPACIVIALASDPQQVERFRRPWSATIAHPPPPSPSAQQPSLNPTSRTHTAPMPWTVPIKRLP